MLFLIEMVKDRRIDSGEFLQSSRAPEAKHRQLSSSKQEMRILGAIVRLAARFLFWRIADDIHRHAK